MLIRRLAAGFFVLHGVAHVIGFAGSWRLGEFEEVPYTTTILNGTLDVGDLGIRLVGLLWLLAAAGFVIGAVALLRERYGVVAAVTLFSLGLCVVGLPAAIAGVWIDLAIIATLAAIALLRPMVLRPAHR